MEIKRDKENALIGGVCAGLANHFEMDVTIMRLLFLASTVFLGVGPVIYILLWIFMPSE